MALSLRCVQLVAACTLLALLVACSSGSAESTESTQSSESAEATPESTVVATPQPATSPTPAPAAAPTATAESETAEPTTIQLWYPRPGEDPTPHPLIERQVVFANGSTAQQRINLIVDLWMASPTRAEADAAGIVIFNFRFSHCEPAFEVEATETAALITLCTQYQPDGDARIEASLKQTLIASGLINDVGLLYADRQNCLGIAPDTESGTSDPLWCVPDEFRILDANRCPFGRATTTALVTGVDEWANTRLAPSLDADLADRISVNERVTIYPSTLSRDGNDAWWITVQLLGRGRCANIAAQLLTGTFGNVADVVPGVSYSLPTTGSWLFADRDSTFDGATWYLDGSVSTSVSLHIFDGRRIDQLISSQLDTFERLDYDYPDDWYDTVEIDGADRAVQPVTIISESGDVGRSQRWIEVGDFTIVAEHATYIEDFDAAPLAEMEAFLESIRIDRPAFLDALTVAGTTSATLFGQDYLAIPEISNGQYTDSSACGTRYDFYLVSESGQRRFAGRLYTTDPTELSDQYLMWALNCEGGDSVVFTVGQVNDVGVINVLGTVRGSDVGVRADYGSHVVNNDGSITFEGQNPNGDVFIDTFELSDLLDQIGS